MKKAILVILMLILGVGIGLGIGYREDIGNWFKDLTNKEEITETITPEENTDENVEVTIPSEPAVQPEE